MSIELLLWTHITLLFLKNQINDNIVNLCIKTHTHTNEEEPKKKKKLHLNCCSWPLSAWKEWKRNWKDKVRIERSQKMSFSHSSCLRITNNVSYNASKPPHVALDNRDNDSFTKWGHTTSLQHRPHLGCLQISHYKPQESDMTKGNCKYSHLFHL